MVTSDLTMALVFVFVGLPVIGFVIYQMFATIRDAPRPGALRDNAPTVDLASSSSPQGSGSTAQVLPAAGIDPAFAWNVAVIVVGSLIGVIGLGAWLVADPTNSAFRQTRRGIVADRRPTWPHHCHDRRARREPRACAQAT
jgi:hypothetical protein